MCISLYTFSMGYSSVVDNSKILYKDFTAIRVDRVVEGDYYLIDGSKVSSKDVKGYVKVLDNYGMWYIKDKCLIVSESTFNDIIIAFIPTFVLFILGIVYSIVIRKCFCIRYNIVRICIIGYIVLFIFSVCVLFSWLSL